jgi:hypothetical protein
VAWPSCDRETQIAVGVRAGTISPAARRQKLAFDETIESSCPAHYGAGLGRMLRHAFVIQTLLKPNARPCGWRRIFYQTQQRAGCTPP